MGEVTHADGAAANRYIDLDDASVDDLRSVVTLDADTREQIGNDITALINDERVPITDLDEAEYRALKRVAQEQCHDTSRLLLPADDPAFY